MYSKLFSHLVRASLADFPPNMCLGSNFANHCSHEETSWVSVLVAVHYTL